MTPATQTRLHIVAPDGTVIQKGNCYQAAVASLMDLPIDDVPNFIEYSDETWVGVFNNFLAEKGFEYAWGYEIPEGYAIASGVSPRARKDYAIYHAVIVLDGKLVHDPHPDRTGVYGEYRYYETIRRIA